MTHTHTHTRRGDNHKKGEEMRANGLAIPFTVGRPRYPVHSGGLFAARSLLESWFVVSCMVTVPGAACAPLQRMGGAVRRERAVGGASRQECGRWNQAGRWRRRREADGVRRVGRASSERQAESGRWVERAANIEITAFEAS